jgi:hypothetical protein
MVVVSGLQWVSIWDRKAQIRANMVMWGLILMVFLYF